MATMKQQQRYSTQYENVIREQRRILLTIQQQNAFEGVERQRLAQTMLLENEKEARHHHHHHDPQQRQYQRPNNQDNSVIISSSDGSSSFSQNSHNDRQKEFFHLEGVICQCCFEETTNSSSSYVTCKNDATPHNICSTCVTRYVRGWLHGGNSGAAIQGTSRINNYKGGRIPCICSLTTASSSSHNPHMLCTSFLKVKDWNTILSPPEVVQVKQKLRGGTPRGNTKRVAPIIAMNTNSRTLPPVPPTTTKAVGQKERDRLEESLGMSQRKESRQRTQHQIEEIKTCAKLRSCPTCDKTFMKENGCNKMKCPQCLTHMCYCCRLVIPQQGYDHFVVPQQDTTTGTDNDRYLDYFSSSNKKNNNHHGTSKQRCPLWTDESMDRQMEDSWVKDRLYHMAQHIRQYPYEPMFSTDDGKKK